MLVKTRVKSKCSLSDLCATLIIQEQIYIRKREEMEEEGGSKGGKRRRRRKGELVTGVGVWFTCNKDLESQTHVSTLKVPSPHLL